MRTTAVPGSAIPARPDPCQARPAPAAHVACSAGAAGRNRLARSALQIARAGRLLAPVRRSPSRIAPAGVLARGLCGALTAALRAALAGAPKPMGRTVLWPAAAPATCGPSRPRAFGSAGAGRLARAAIALISLAPALLVLAAAPAAAQQPVFLPYFNAPVDGSPIHRPPTLGLAIGGAVHRAVMDTGSTGVVIAASSIAGFERLTPLGPGEITYTSSGRIMRGVTVEVPVTIVGADGTKVTTRPIPVLAVTRIDCLRSARDCRPDAAPRRVAMLGIGFARARDRQPGAGPARNPFLNLPGMGATGGAAGPLARGYIVTRRGVQVGLAQQDGASFRKVALQRDAATGDVAPVPVCLALEERTPAACGSLLLDTGVATMFLTLPPAQTEGLETLDPRGARVLADGVGVSIRPGPDAAAPAYSFKVGDHDDPVVPERVILVGRGQRPPFVNTTVRALNAFDYLFDAEAGAVGFRPLATR